VPMIIREWRARATPDGAAAYADHFGAEVVPELRRLAGFRGAHLLRGDTGAEVELVVLTRWATLDAVRAFAGPELDRAVVQPAARAVLSAWDDEVRHYEVLAEVASS